VKEIEKLERSLALEARRHCWISACGPALYQQPGGETRALTRAKRSGRRSTTRKSLAGGARPLEELATSTDSVW